jgi:hypothetical protein
MYVTFHFGDGQCVDIDVIEFEHDGAGTIVDHLAAIHGGVIRVETHDSQ